jgi:hypothetical protein
VRRTLLSALSLAMTGVSISGCQACDEANQKAQQIQDGYNEVQKAEQEAKKAKQSAEQTATDAAGLANEAQNQVSAAAKAVGEGNKACGGYKPAAGETTEQFVHVFLEVSQKDNPAVQLVLGAVSAGNDIAFFDHLVKLAKGEDRTQAQASCMLDRFYGLIPDYHGQLETVVEEVSTNHRTREWYQLTPGEKIKASHYIVAGNPLYVLIKQDIQTHVPKGL